MMLKDDLELEVTKEKLAGLQKLYESSSRDKSGNLCTRELSLRSLKKLINQLTEEILRYEARAGHTSPS
jgi:hypothetical protein